MGNERLSQDFDIEPVAGVPLTPPLPPVEAPAEQPEEEIQAEQPEEEQELSVDATDDETETEEPQDAEAWQMPAREFAKEVGLSRKELYNNVLLPTDRGEQTLSKVLDGYNDLAQQNQHLTQELTTERQQREEISHQASAMQVGQQLAPRVQELGFEFKQLENQYYNAPWDQYEPDQRRDLKEQIRDRMDLIRRNMNQEQNQFELKRQEALAAYERETEAEKVRMIPEWASSEVRSREQPDIDKFMASEGFSQDRIAAVHRDPLSLKLVRKAWRALSSQEEISRGAKKIRKLSKSFNTGAKRGAAKATLAEAGKRVKEAGLTRAERQNRRMSVEFDIPTR